MKRTAICLATIPATYLMFVFISMEPNVFDWDWQGRLTFLMVAGGALIIAIVHTIEPS